MTTSRPTHADAIAAHDDVKRSIHQTYVDLTIQWARQTRNYTRSLRAYQRTNQRRQRLSRALPEAADVVSRIPTLPPLLPAPTRGDDALLPATTAPMTPAPITETASPSITTAPLTHRQFEIARLIADGLSNDEIAQELVLTSGTVGNHVGHI